MNRSIGFMQGRLCELVQGKIQAFPWRDWEYEFQRACAIDLRVMEWTLDQDRLYENPLMTAGGQKLISQLSQSYGVEIPSLTGDCFMQAPFWKTSSNLCNDLQLDFLRICDACAEVGIRMIVVPLVDGGRLETSDQENKLVEFLWSQQTFLAERKLKIIFESDYIPLDLSRFIERLPVDLFGINYDIGNSAALGFDPQTELEFYGSRILNVHVKDRVLGGPTVPLMTGHADFSLVFSELAKLDYNGNFILQTSRASDGNHIGDIVKYRDMVGEWISAKMST
jgi:L-ribulose-5-phosphate 3-epimerase